MTQQFLDKRSRELDAVTSVDMCALWVIALGTITKGKPHGNAQGTSALTKHSIFRR